MTWLPFELRLSVLQYLPLKDFQRLHDQGYQFDLASLQQLLHWKYGLTPAQIQIGFADKLNQSILTPFDQFVKMAMLAGDIGFAGQLYVRPDICLMMAVQSADNELIKYYLDRFHYLIDYKRLKTPEEQAAEREGIARAKGSEEEDEEELVERSMYRIDTNKRRYKGLLRYLAEKTNNVQTIGYLQQGIQRLPQSHLLSATQLLKNLRDRPNTVFRVALVSVNLMVLREHINVFRSLDFPDIRPNSIINVGRFVIMTEDLYQTLPAVIHLVQTNFPASPTRDQYLQSLKVLLNQDSSNPKDIGLALVVLNEPILSKLVTGYRVTARIFVVPFSERLYDVPLFALMEQQQNRLYTEILGIIRLSIWMAKRQLEYVNLATYLTPVEELYLTGAGRIRDAETARFLAPFMNIEPLLEFNEQFRPEDLSL